MLEFTSYFRLCQTRLHRVLAPLPQPSASTRSAPEPLCVLFSKEPLPLFRAIHGEAIASFQDLRRAARKLDDALDEQRIVWLDGRHLPNAILISPSAKVQAVTQ